MAHSQDNVWGNVFWVIASSLIAMHYACDNLKYNSFQLAYYHHAKLHNRNHQPSFLVDMATYLKIQPHRLT